MTNTDFAPDQDVAEVLAEDAADVVATEAEAEAEAVSDTETSEEEFEVNLPDMSYDQFEKVKEAVIAKQREQKEKERDAALNTIKGLVLRYGFKWADIKPAKASSAGKGTRGPVAPKYRNPETGDTWSGRGRAPLWIRDYEDKSQFLID